MNPIMWFSCIGLILGWLAGELAIGWGVGVPGNLVIGMTGALIGGLLSMSLGGLACLANLNPATIARSQSGPAHHVQSDY